MKSSVGPRVSRLFTSMMRTRSSRACHFFAGVAYALQGRVLVLGPTRFQLLPHEVDGPEWSVYAPDAGAARADSLAAKAPTGRLMGQLFG